MQDPAAAGLFEEMDRAAVRRAENGSPMSILGARNLYANACAFDIILLNQYYQRHRCVNNNKWWIF